MFPYRELITCLVYTLLTIRVCEMIWNSGRQKPKRKRKPDSDITPQTVHGNYPLDRERGTDFCKGRPGGGRVSKK